MAQFDQATLFIVPGATLLALGIAALVRFAYGPGLPFRRPKLLAALVASLAGVAIWRVLPSAEAVPPVVDLTAGILCGLLIAAALKAAWRDGPFERTPKGIENTPAIIMLFAGALALGAVVVAAASATQPASGQYVQALPPGNWQ